jgi:hypothetical protein
MITETGKNLSVVIVTEVGKDWQTYSTWYSFYKNLPDADMSMVILRNDQTPYQMFQWAKRIQVPHVFDRAMSHIILLNLLDATRTAIKKMAIGERILIVEPLTMAIDALSPDLLEMFNEDNALFENEGILYLHDQNIDDLLNAIMLYEQSPFEHQPLAPEAKDTEDLVSLVSYRKGCGKWIDTLKGCPFSNAAGLATATMTANENRIIELWKKMCSLYSTLT